MINPDPKDPAIKDICLRNLSAIHNVPLATLEAQYVDHYTTAWYSEPLARGAYAINLKRLGVTLITTPTSEIARATPLML